MLAKLLRIMLVGAALAWAAPPVLGARAQEDYPLSCAGGRFLDRRRRLL